MVGCIDGEADGRLDVGMLEGRCVGNDVGFRLVGTFVGLKDGVTVTVVVAISLLSGGVVVVDSILELINVLGLNVGTLFGSSPPLVLPGPSFIVPGPVVAVALLFWLYDDTTPC